MTNRRVTEDYIKWVGYDDNGDVRYKSALVHGGFEAGFNYGREHGLELAEDALDAANAKLARIEMILNDLKYDVTASVESYDDLIREVLNGR